MVNSELFRQIADKIESEPENYDQTTYVCGTAHCVAGWACVLTGNDPYYVRSPFHAARELLGISPSDSYELFDHDWMPREGLTVPEALRLIADGETIESVSRG